MADFITKVITEKRKFHMRSNLVCFQQFILIFIIFVVLSLQDKKASSLINTQSLSPKKCVPFSSSNDTIKYQVNISKLGLQNVYNVVEEYTFFIPEISFVCECACTDRDELTCSEKTDSDDDDCAYLINSTTSCTRHHSYGKDTSVCPTYYRMCCQVFFSKNDLIKEFRAVHIKHKTSILKLQIELKSSEGKINIDVQVLQGIKYFQLISDDSVYSVHFTPDRLLSSDWYFLEEGSSELFFSEKMNEIDEYNLDKIGWFQSRKNQVSRVPLEELKQKLRVKPLNCHRPTYEWTLNATGYYNEEGLSRFRNERKKVSEMNKNSIKKISLNLKQRMINVEAKRTATFDTSLISTDPIPFMFTSNISLLLEQEPVLSLEFTRGDGDTRIEITNPHWRTIVSFSMNVANASTDRPVQCSFDLPPTTVELFLVCVIQSERQICQSPIIIKEKIIFANETLVHFSTEIIGNDATDDYDETQKSKYSFILSLITTAFTLGLLIVSIITGVSIRIKETYTEV